MNKRVAVILTNYNMPERSDALGDYLKEYAKWPHDFICVDNASDIMPPSKYTTVTLTKNAQTTGGWLAGVNHADILEKQGHFKYLAYVFAITSCDWPEWQKLDPIAPLARVLLSNKNAVGIHPALTDDSTTDWHEMKTRNAMRGPRPIWHLDNLFAMYRADWFNSIGRFDPELTYAHGPDLETGWYARQQHRGLFIHEDVQIRKITNIGYDMGRMNMSAQQRAAGAMEEMQRVLGRKWGAWPECWNRLISENVESWMR
jgi:hypothetical protein